MLSCILRKWVRKLNISTLVVVGLLLVSVIIAAAVVFFSLCSPNLQSPMLVRWDGFFAGLSHFFDILVDPVLLASICNSLAATGSALLVMLAFAYVLSWLLYGKSLVIKSLCVTLLCWSVFVPSLFAGYAVCVSFEGVIAFCAERGWSFPPILLGLIYVYWPYVFLPVFVAVHNVPSSYIKSAQDLGGGSRDVLLRLILPMTRRGAFVGFCVAAPLLLFDPVVPLMLAKGGGNFIGSALWDAMFFDVNLPKVASVGVSLMLLWCCCVLVMRWRSS